MQLVRDQRIEISLSPSAASPPTTEVILSREERALASLVGRAARSERARPHRGPGDDQTFRHPSRLCHLARVGDSVTRPRQPLHTLFSDQLASPEEPHTFFSQMVLTSSSLLPALLSLPPSLAGSAGLPVWFCLAFAYGSTISSSTSSLRIAWVFQRGPGYCTADRGYP